MKKLTKQTDRGVAIILALIFLVIFMILAFAFTARAVAASRSATYQSAELQSLNACETALQSAIYKMKSTLDVGTISAYPDSTSLTPATFNATTFTSNIFTGFNDGTASATVPQPSDVGFDFFQLTNFAPTSDPAAFTWIKLSTPNTTGETSKENVAYTWYAIPMSGRIDPNYSFESDGRALPRSGLTDTTDPVSGYKHEIHLNPAIGATVFWKSIRHCASLAPVGTTDTAWMSFLPHSQSSYLPAKTSGSIDLSTAATRATIDAGTMSFPALPAAASTGVDARMRANLFDFLDSNDTCTPTADGDLGVEPKKPLFNELQFNVINKSVSDGTGTSVVLSVEFGAELVRLLDFSSDENYDVNAAGTIGFTYTDDLGGGKLGSINFNGSLSGAFKIRVLMAKEYYKNLNSELTTPTPPPSFSFNLPAGRTLRNSGQITITSFILSSISMSPITDKISIKPATSVTLNANLDVNRSWFMNFSAWDARVNGQLDHTATHGDTTNLWLAKQRLDTDYANLGVDNGIFAPVDGTDDSEDSGITFMNASTIKGLTSTSYGGSAANIKNLSVLGLISRGQRFKTLNIVDRGTGSFSESTYRDSSADYTIAANGGDGALLDVFTMGTNDPDTLEVDIFNVINPNAASSTVLSGLFQDINVDDNAGPSATPIINNFPTPLSFSKKSFPLWSLADLTKRNPPYYGKPFSSAIGISDRAKEEYYWKTKNLVSPNTCYYMIVTAVKTAYSINTTSSTTLASSQQSSARMIAIVKRDWDVSSNKFVWKVISREFKQE